MAFDPTIAQTRDYVRVQVKFNVSRPLRRSKIVNIPGGGSINLLLDYDRVQKICYRCQQLSHEKEVCPLVLREQLEKAYDMKNYSKADKLKPSLVIKEDDPLFGGIKGRSGWP